MLFFSSILTLLSWRKTKKGSVSMGILGGNPKDEPLHYGEVFSVWSSLMAD